LNKTEVELKMRKIGMRWNEGEIELRLREKEGSYLSWVEKRRVVREREREIRIWICFFFVLENGARESARGFCTFIGLLPKKVKDEKNVQLRHGTTVNTN
jgi:hypothetical protein